MSGKLDRPASPYLQIADAIREEIRQGRLRPGDRVPSVRDVMREYDVAIATAQRAMRLLQTEGYVRSEHGLGNLVTTEAERGSGAGAWVERARRTGKIYPDGQYAQILSAEVATAPESVVGALGLDAGADAIRRIRVTHLADGPLSWSVSWFSARHAEVAPKLLDVARIPEGTFSYLAAALGRRAVKWRDQLEAVGASTEDAERLNVREASPVHRCRNWIYDDSGDLLEYGESVSTSRLMYEGDIVA